MRTALLKFIPALFGSLLLSTPLFAYAAPTIVIQSISPGASVSVGQTLTFTAVGSGLSGSTPTYLVFDDVNGTSITSSSINASTGIFTWTPLQQDSGVHNLTVEATDGTGLVAIKTIAIGVGTQVAAITTTASTTPSLDIQSLSPGSSLTLGQAVSFVAVPTAFTPVSYTVSDSYSSAATSIKNANITTSGIFSWIPTTTDVGSHSVTIIATNASGTTLSKTTTLQVANSSSANTSNTVVAPVIPTTTVTPISSVASFTSTQIQAIAAMLQAFGASSAVVAQVTSVLSGTATVATTATTDTVSSGSGFGYVFTSLLEMGSSGTAVSQLQGRLTELGFYSGPINGNFGPATKAAVIKLQAAHGLTQAGYVGPSTRAVLNGN